MTTTILNPGGKISSAPYQVPRPRFGAGALGLAVVMHGLLFVLLFFGLRWQSQPPAVIEAELWRAVPEIAAPAPEPQAAPEPPRPEPRVVPKATPRDEPTPRKPDIALKRQEEKKKAVQKEAPKPEPKKQLKPEPKVAPKVEARVEPKAPPKPETPRTDTPPEARAPSDLQNLLAEAAKPSSGTAPRTAGLAGNNAYADAIKARILSNLRFPVPADMAGNPEAVFAIEQLPTGEIRNVVKQKSSGLPAFDAAVERAINASSPLPKSADGRVERSVILTFRPLERR